MFRRPVLFVLSMGLVLCLVSTPVQAQPKLEDLSILLEASVDHTPPLVTADQIQGALSEIEVLNGPGATVRSGQPLIVDFRYATATPGEVAVGIEVIGRGGRQEYLVYEPFVLKTRQGHGSVSVSYEPPRSADSLRAEQVSLYLYPAGGALGRRDVTTLAGPFEFEGAEPFTTGHRERIDRLEAEVAELKRIVADLQRAAAP